MSERAYTVREVDRMRDAIERAEIVGGRNSDDLARDVHNRLLEYMHGNADPEDVISSCLQEQLRKEHREHYYQYCHVGAHPEQYSEEYITRFLEEAKAKGWDKPELDLEATG